MVFRRFTLSCEGPPRQATRYLRSSPLPLSPFPPIASAHDVHDRNALNFNPVKALRTAFFATEGWGVASALIPYPEPLVYPARPEPRGELRGGLSFLIRQNPYSSRPTIFRIFFQVPYALTLLFSHSSQNCRGGGATLPILEPHSADLRPSRVCVIPIGFICSFTPNQVV